MENRELPQPLEKEEQKIYFTSYRLLNDSPMKEKLIAHNMRLATKRVYNKFINTPYDIEELISAGYEGLVKSVCHYDVNKDVPFSCYAYKAIDNTVIKYMDKEKKHIDVLHLETIVRSKNQDEESLEYIDTLKDESTVEDIILRQEEYQLVRDIVESLPEKKKRVIKELYGFNDGEEHTLMEVGKKLGMTYQNVSKIAKKTLPIIKEKLEKNDESYKRLVKRR
ncbi:MAG: sigma-70 family RNA polymerase sigma factor [bacterium]|nr:sigma-70 family RNA polymerase sigma factor [bacterium]